MRAYTALLRVRFVNALQYRAAALAGLVTQFAWGFMEILAFAAFYRADPAAFPMTFPQTVSYIWMSEAFLVLFTAFLSEDDISEAIMSGAIAYELVRPMDIYHRWLFQNIANRLARTVLRSAPLLLITFFLPEPYRMILPANLGQLALFLLSTVLALGVVGVYSMLVYISAFYTLSFRGARLVLGNLAIFLSGSIIPIPFFPTPIRNLAELLPFAAMQNMPLRIYSGHIAGADALQGIGLQLFWLAMLWALGRFAMSRALKRVIVQGG